MLTVDRPATGPTVPITPVYGEWFVVELGPKRCTTGVVLSLYLTRVRKVQTDTIQKSTG